MPNIKSAKKRMKTSAARHEQNKSVKSGLTSQRRKLYEAIAAGEKSSCEELFRVYGSLLDKAAKKGIIKANNAARRKSRAAAKMAAL